MWEPRLKCPGCGAERVAGLPCPNCIPGATKNIKTQPVVCPRCGYRNPPGKDYCRQCGSARRAERGAKPAQGSSWRALARLAAPLLLAAALILIFWMLGVHP